MATITYNSYTLPNQFGKVTYHENEKELSISTSFLVTAASASALVIACQTAETALTEINKDFSMAFGGSSEFSLTHAGNSGFNAKPTLNKLGSDLATETARPYSFSVTIGLPFSQSGYYYRREGSFTVDYASNRKRQVSFRVLYTASTVPATALVNYNATTGGGKWWAASILTGLGGTYELVSENISEDIERKIVTANLRYREILSNQSISGTNDANIVDPQLSLSVNYEQEIAVSETGTGFIKLPKAHVSVSFSCKVDHDQVTSESLIGDVYQIYVKPLIIDKVFDYLDMSDYQQTGRNYIVESEQKSFNVYDWSISANLSLLVIKTNDQVIELEESVTTTDDKGIVSEKLWNGVDETENVWSIGATKRISRTITVSKLSSEPNTPPELTLPGYNLILSNRNFRRSMASMGEGTPELSKAGGRLKIYTVYIITWSESYLAIKETGTANFIGVTI